MSAKNDWGGAEKYGVNVLAGCLTEKLNKSIITLIATAENILTFVENPEAAAFCRKSIDKAKAELLTQED